MNKRSRDKWCNDLWKSVHKNMKEKFTFCYNDSDFKFSTMWTPVTIQREVPEDINEEARYYERQRP